MGNKINANGIDINYQIEGPEDAPVIMFSNSLASNLGMWDGQAAAFSGDYRILRADTRGHGQTEPTSPPYSVQLLLDDALALLDALGIDKVHFCGLSLGGMIGQRFGAFNGDRLHSLTICDTTAEMRDPSLWDTRIAAARENGMEGIRPTTVSRWFTEAFVESGDPVLDKVGVMIESTPLDGFIGCCEAIKVMDQVDILADIKTPTLIINGKQDQSTTVEHAQFLNDNIAGSKLVILDPAAHLSNVEQEGEFNAALKSHIDAN
ncbi:MAG TPA: 3-oxoadipate enol-lactonase [Rhodospirillaceae bacterium]|nr:3-oxoadipate enol-lactonase [Rhodospirillaceae bacterium]HAT35491.1 3-oxoadipate enol-lactonase [Rhodospirillaceae bacterium]